jgi:phosphoribosylformylglycinamidine synthase
MDKGLVLSCHDCSDGGLAVAAAEMCISGDIGAEIDIPRNGMDTARALYSESNSRWLAEVDVKDVASFKEIMRDDATDIGRTGGASLKIPKAGLDMPVKELRKAWNDPIWSIMGGSGK